MPCRATLGCAVQVSVVDVFRAIARAKERTPREQKIDWAAVQADLVAQFGVESFSQLCVRVQLGVGYPIKKCIESWQDQKARVVPQLQQEALRLAQLLAKVSVARCIWSGSASQLIIAPRQAGQNLHQSTDKAAACCGARYACGCQSSASSIGVWIAHNTQPVALLDTPAFGQQQGS